MIAFEVINACRSFPRVKALNDVSLDKTIIDIKMFGKYNVFPNVPFCRKQSGMVSMSGLWDVG
ncbi:MAG: hypothetical protein FWH55_07100 [Oscillospiraceae bacterium]|nr:hypothetical protein [Oscillospiraceae bacterium]